MPSDSTVATNDSIESKPKKKSSAKKKDVLILHNLSTQIQDTLQNAKGLHFQQVWQRFCYNYRTRKKDSTNTPGVLFIDLDNYSKKRISNEIAEYKSLSFDEDGKQLIYLATKDTSKIEQKVFDVRYFSNQADSAIILANTSSVELPNNWIFNENSSYFAKNGKRVIIGSAPKQAPKRHHYSRL